MTIHRTASLLLLAAAVSLSASLHASTLRIGVVEGAEFGYRFDGVNTHRTSVSFEFSRQSTDVILSYVVYDIDASDELAIEVNGRVVGQAVATENEQTGKGTLRIRRDQMVEGTNEIVFRQRVSGYHWGVTDLRLDRDTTQAVIHELELDVTDDGSYGYRYNGSYDYREGAGFRFDGTGEELILYYSAYDIDSSDEVSVELNGTPIGFLARTESNGSRDDLITIPAAQQRSGRNSLVLRQRVSGYTWGVTNLLLMPADWCL